MTEARDVAMVREAVAVMLRMMQENGLGIRETATDLEVGEVSVMEVVTSLVRLYRAREVLH